MGYYFDERFKHRSWKSDDEEDESTSSYTPWWKRKSEKRYTSRLGFGADDHRRSYSYDYGRSYYGGGSYYSSYRDKEKSRDFDVEKLDILKVAFSNSRDLVNILEFPFRVNIYYDYEGWKRNKMYHDSSRKERNIFINSVSYLDNILKCKSDINEENKEKCIQVISGNSIHEAAHLLYTTIAPITRFFGDLYNVSIGTQRLVKPSYTADIDKFIKSINSGIDESDKCIISIIIYSLFNFLETERVDTVLLEERNGWYSYISDYKEYCYNNAKLNLFSSSLLSTSGKDNVDLTEFFGSLLTMIRYPEKVKENIFEKYSYSLSRVREWLAPKSTVNSCLNAFSIFKEVIIPIWNMHGKPIDEFNKKIKNNTLPEAFLKKPLDASVTSTISRMIKSVQGDVNVYSGSDEELLNSYDLLISKFDGRCLSDTFTKSSLDIITGEIEGDYKTGIYFYKPVGDLTNYNNIKNKISEYIPVIKKMVKNVNKNFDFCIYGQRTGKLDTTKLAEAYQGVPQVYVKQGVTRTSGMHVCVVIDESGSMNWNYRAQRARETGVLLNEAFGFIPGVNLYMYGHSADQVSCGYSTEIYIYREPGLSSTVRPGLGCSEITGRSENRDGHALKAIGERVRKFTKQPVLMFVVSDGSPSAEKYRGGPAIKDTKDKVSQLEKDGFYIIQVTINSDGVDASQMFTNYVDLTEEISQLPQVLSAVVRDQIVKILQNNTTTTTI